MKILYLDFLYPQTHLRLDINYIKCLSKIGKVYVLSPKGRYTNLPKSVKLIEKEYMKVKEGRVFKRLSSLKIMGISATVANKLNPDYIFVSNYETIIFSIGRLFFKRKNRFVLLNHNNIDELTNKVKLFLFKIYMNKVEHIVFEDFIRDYLIQKIGIDRSKIHVIPHHMMSESLNVQYSKMKYSCVGLSYSNDEEVIENIVNLEKNEELLKKSGHKVILKSNVIEFDNGFLKIVRGFIEDDLFQEYMNSCQCVYLPFSSGFCYRMSGTLVDALANNKMVLGNNIPLLMRYSKKYPKICKIVNNADEFFNYILNTDDISDDIDFSEFKKEHSTEKIISELRYLFKGYMEV